MASYALYLGSPVGKAILTDKTRRRNPDDSLEIEDSEVLALGLAHDPYADYIWSGPELDALGADLEHEISVRHQEAVGAVLTETRRSRVEPWMDSMIASQLAADTRDALARKLLELVTRAQREAGALIFWGD